MNRENPRKINGIPALLFWVGVWWIASAGLNNVLLLPGPVRVLRCLAGLMQTAAFWQTVAVSIGRILLGVISAVLLGCILAVVTSFSRLMEMLIAPAMTAMQATPVASFTILVLIWLDRDYVPVLICGMMVLPVIWGSVSTGIWVTDRQLLEMGQVFRLSPVTRLVRIWIPSVMPFFRTAFTSSMSLGWKAGIAAEVLTVPKASIGRMISEAKLYLMTEDLFAWTLLIVLLSMLCARAFGWLLKAAAAALERM
jgi:NitT/TauT family transport system permease protein